MLPTGDWKYLIHGGNTTIKQQKTIGIYKLQFVSNRERSHINIYRRYFHKWKWIDSIDGNLMFYNGLTNEWQIERRLR